MQGPDPGSTPAPGRGARDGRYLETQGEASGPHPPHVRAQQVVGEQPHVYAARSRTARTGRRVVSLTSFPGLSRSILLDTWEERKRRTFWTSAARWSRGRLVSRAAPGSIWQEIATAQAQWFWLS